MDCGSDVAGLSVHLRCEVSSRETVIAAALGKLSLNAVTGLHDGGVSTRLSERYLFAELTDVTLYIVAEAADAVSDVSQTVVELAKLLAKQDFLLRSSAFSESTSEERTSFSARTATRG